MLTVTNSTISGNLSGSHGGGISNSGNATVQLNNVTITNNTGGTAIVTASGGGVEQNGGLFTLQNTLIAGNHTSSSGNSPDCVSIGSFFTSQGHNLIQDTAGCVITGDLTGNIIGQDPKLGTLVNNSGPTPTHGLLASSPAIDAGNPVTPGSGDSACTVLDQRGFLRPLGGACDIGAFERGGAFSLAKVLPDTGGNTGSISAIVSGNGFVSGTTIKLVRTGQPDIIGNPVQVDVGGSAIAVTFDLVGKSMGPWDVVVMNPDGTLKTLAGGFTIEQGRAPQLWVDIIGQLFRPGRRSRLTVLYGNRGNVDAIGVPLSLSFPGGYAPSRFFAITSPPPQPGQVRDDWSQVPVDVRTDEQSGFVDIPLLLPVVPAGFMGRLQIGLTLPSGAQDTLLLAAIGDPVFNPDLDPDVVRDAVTGAQAYLQNNGVTVPSALVPDLEEYMTHQFQQVEERGRAAFVASLGTQSQVYSLSQLHFDLIFFAAVRAAETPQASTTPKATFDWASARSRLLTSLLSVLGPPEAQAQQQNCPIAPKKGEVLPPGCSGGGGPDEPFLPPKIPPAPGGGLTKDHCEALPGYKIVRNSSGEPFCVPEKPPDNCLKLAANPVGGNLGCMPFPIKPKNSADPNDKVGTLGATPAQFLVSGVPLSYTVFFENLETATAPAQEVVITDQLDVQRMDLDTFSFGPISFGDVTVTPAPGVRQYTAGVDLRPEQNVIVAIHANLDKDTGLLTWRFISIDPGTGQFTEDPNAGFLPPNVNPPEGDGSVVFTVDPKRGLATGTQICNKVSIVFDVNDPIITPQWCNALDNTKPQSQVLPLAAAQSSPTFAVQWTGTDVGTGIADYTIFVSENGSPFSPFISNTTATSATFTGRLNNTYAFYSVARDQAGNAEEAPATPDAATQISLPTCAVNVTAQVTVTRGGFRRNSVTSRYVQQVTLKNNGSQSISGPVSLVLDNLSGNATLFNKDGDSGCAIPVNPYKNVGVGADNVLSPGESATVVFEFANPSNQGITYSARVLAGTPQ